jgi:hypothetical protein
MKEIWKDVFEYEGIYKVSNLGNIKSLNRIIHTIEGKKYFTKERLLNARLDTYGIAKVNLSKDGIKITYSLARLVYKAFNPEFDIYNNDLIIRHKNNKGEDNKPENLYVFSRNIPKLIETYKKDKQPVICTTTNKEFKCVTDASRYYNVNAGSINKCCKSELKSSGKIVLDDGTVYKLVWKYV